MKTITIHTTFKNCTDEYVKWYCERIERQLQIGKTLLKTGTAEFKTENEGVIGLTIYSISEDLQ